MKTDVIIFVIRSSPSCPLSCPRADLKLYPLPVSLLLRQNQRPQSTTCPFPGCACVDGVPDGVPPYPRKTSTYDTDHPRFPSFSAPPPHPLGPMPIPPMRAAYAWDDRERDDAGSPHTSSTSASVGGSPARKHARSWDSEVSRFACHFSSKLQLTLRNRRTLRFASASRDPCRTRHQCMRHEFVSGAAGSALTVCATPHYYPHTPCYPCYAALRSPAGVHTYRFNLCVCAQCQEDQKGKDQGGIDRGVLMMTD